MAQTIGSTMADEVVIIDPATGKLLSMRHIVAQSAEHYYATAEGGRVAFNVTSGLISLGVSGGIVLIFENLSGSQIDCHLARFLLTGNTIGRFERYRNGTISGNRTALTPINRGGGTNTPKAKAYLSSGASAANGILSKIQFFTANTEDVAKIDGSIILRPGQNLYWNFNPTGMNSSSNSIELVWWELAAQP